MRGAWIRCARLLSVTSIVLFAPLVFPQEPNLNDLLTSVRKGVETADFRATGHLIWVQPSGERLSYPVTVKAHWFPGMLRLRVDVGQPSTVHRDVREHVLLEMRPNGDATMRVADPGDSAAKILPFEKWNEHPVAPGFSYEDLLQQQYFWPGQTSEGNAKFGARNCLIVKSTPSASDRTHYAQVKTWFDPSIDFPVYLEKTVKDSGAVKEFTYFGIRHEEGVWSAHQVEVKVRGQSGSTLLIFDRGSVKAHLTAADFDPAHLTDF